MALVLLVVVKVGGVVGLLMELITGCPGKVGMEESVGNRGASPYLTV